MATRVVIVAALTYVLLRHLGDYTSPELLAAGAFWMALWRVFEWGGSALQRRPVREILAGWHVERGYMWPYVLLVPLLFGITVHPGR